MYCGRMPWGPWKYFRIVSVVTRELFTWKIRSYMKIGFSKIHVLSNNLGTIKIRSHVKFQNSRGKKNVRNFSSSRENWISKNWVKNQDSMWKIRSQVEFRKSLCEKKILLNLGHSHINLVCFTWIFRFSETENLGSTWNPSDSRTVGGPCLYIWWAGDGKVGVPGCPPG